LWSELVELGLCFTIHNFYIKLGLIRVGLQDLD